MKLMLINIQYVFGVAGALLFHFCVSVKDNERELGKLGA